MDWKNKLYFGDNLGILREHVAAEIEYPSGPIAREETFAKAERKTRHQQEELF